MSRETSAENIFSTYLSCRTGVWFSRSLPLPPRDREGTDKIGSCPAEHKSRFFLPRPPHPRRWTSAVGLGPPQLPRTAPAARGRMLCPARSPDRRSPPEPPHRPLPTLTGPTGPAALRPPLRPRRTPSGPSCGHPSSGTGRSGDAAPPPLRLRAARTGPTTLWKDGNRPPVRGSVGRPWGSVRSDSLVPMNQVKNVFRSHKHEQRGSVG